VQPSTYLNHDTDEISYSNFINRELILFSMADNICSIPQWWMALSLVREKLFGHASNES